jgi:hypothetical protein
MLRTPGTHTDPHDTTAHLTYAAAVVAHADIEQRLAPHRPPRSTRGVKPQLPSYTTVAILCVIYELVAKNIPTTINEIVKALWYRYTPAQMKIIGLDRSRDPQRAQTLYPGPKATEEQRLAGAKVFAAEYTRLWQAIRDLFAPMDDTPLVANRSSKKRPTVAEVRDAATNPDLVPKTALKHDVINALIASGLHVANALRRPGTTIHDGGILDHYLGHLGIDETHLTVGTWALRKGIAPGNYMARTHGHSKVYKGAPSNIGLTLAVTVAHPDQPTDVPALCLGAAIHHPTGGLGPAALRAVDAIEENNLRAQRRSSHTQQIVFDGGYTEAIDLNRGLAARGYGMVMKYAKDQQTLHEIMAINHPDGTRTPGLIMFNGRLLCPGAAKALLARAGLTVPDFKDRINLDGTKRAYTGKELADREDLLARILPLVMPTNGRPKEMPGNPRGGQAKNAITGEPVMQVTVTCPDMAGKVRCPIWSDFHNADRAHLPIVPNPPSHLPKNRRPNCCENGKGTMSARIPLQIFKDWQDQMAGTWEHADFYGSARSATERYNALIKCAHGGANLNKGAVPVRKAAPFALFTVMAIVHANRSSIETWYAHIAKTGRTPTHRGQENKERRAKNLAQYRSEQATRRKAK